jgi:thiamine pyrophosphokinase
MLRAWLFINGELSLVPKIKIKKGDILIGVDGGTKHILKLGLKPDVILGDMDSLKKIPKGIRVIKKPDQEQTDTELALNYCRDNKINEVVILGALGRRLDHLSSNLMVMAKSQLKIKIIEGNQELQIIRKKAIIKGKKGDLVSLIPLLADCEKVTTIGLKWGLQGQTLKVGHGRGVSNVMLGKTATVSLKKGCLLMVKTNL